jgi:hypothetical protein
MDGGIIVVIFLILFLIFYILCAYRNTEIVNTRHFGEPCGKYVYCSQGNYCNNGTCLSSQDTPFLQKITKRHLVTTDKLFLNESNDWVTLSTTKPSFTWNYDPLDKIISTSNGRYVTIVDSRLKLSPLTSSTEPTTPTAYIHLMKKDECFYAKESRDNYLFVDCSVIPWKIVVSTPQETTFPLLLRELKPVESNYDWR